MERIALKIGGMTCGHCVRGVNQALGSLPGVQVERVEIGSAVLEYDPSAVAPEQLERAIAEEGYAVTGMERVA